MISFKRDSSAQNLISLFKEQGRPDEDRDAEGQKNILKQLAIP